MTKVDKRLLVDTFVQTVGVGTGLTINNSDPYNPVLGLVPVAPVDTVAPLSFYGALALEQAEDRLTAPVMAGPDGNGIFDGFNILNYVNVAGATNLLTGSGKLRPTEAATILGSAGPFATPSDFSAFTMADMSWKLVNGQTCTKIGYYMRALGAAVTFQLFIVKRNSAGNYDVVVTESLTVTPTVEDWVDKTLTTPFAVPATGDYYVAVKTTTFASAIWAGTGNRAYFTGVPSGTGVTFTEDAGNRIGTRAHQGSGYNNVVVSSELINTDVAPTWAMVFAFAKLNTAVLNTDFILAVTRNNAAYQNLTLTQKYARHDGSRLYTSGKVDLTTTSGTACKWRWTTANAKSPELFAVGLMLGT